MAQPIRLGLIGAGRWGQVYLRTIASLGKRCRVTHLGTSQPLRAALLPRPVQVESDWRRIVDADCDAVIVATPAQTHAQILEACVDARKPCLVEKPFCTDLETAERLHAKITQTSALVLVDHTQLFNPAYQALKTQVWQAREPVRAILAERIGADQWRPELPVVWEWGPHDVSLCLDLMEDMPRHLDALAGPSGLAELPGLVAMRLDFAGACAWIHNGWMAAQKRRSVTVVTNQSLYQLDELAEYKLTVAPQADPLSRKPLRVADGRPAMAAMLAYFLDGLAGGDRRYFGSALALQVTRVLAAAEKCLTLRQSEVSDTSERKM